MRSGWRGWKSGDDTLRGVEVTARVWWLEVDVDGDGAVVAAEDVVEDVGTA